jgi:hypothetical protein
MTFALVIVAPASGDSGLIQTTKYQNGSTGCEYNNAVLDTLAQKTKRDEVIIVIARAGKTETRKGLNQRRLHNVLVYLTEFMTSQGGRRKSSEVILAEGSSNSLYGVIELYAEGKLFGMLRPSRNADLHIGTCVPDNPTQDICSLKTDSNFYPCLDRSRKDRNHR